METASDERAGGISAGEKAVAASRAVDVAAGADVVDGAVQSYVDWFARVAAVVGEEF